MSHRPASPPVGRLFPRLAAAALLASLPLAAPVAAAPEVVVSIKPLHSLVARLMQGVAEPALLVTGGASLHSFSLKPSQAGLLEQADLVVWIGPGFETFLAQPLESLAPDAAQVEALELPGILLLPPREGGVWEAHDHGGEGHEHEHEAEGHEHDDDHDHAHDPAHEGEVDGHLFLDPGNALVIAEAAAGRLEALDPANAATYAANLEGLRGELAALDAEVAAALAAARGKPFVVFHDAYQYFEAHYGLAAIGSITVTPDQPPGARRLGEIRAKLRDLGALCVFAEPGFEPALIETLVEGTAVRTGVLDPEGTALPAGPGTYATLLRDLAHGLTDCLAGG